MYIAYIGIQMGERMPGKSGKWMLVGLERFSSLSSPSFGVPFALSQLLPSLLRILRRKISSMWCGLSLTISLSATVVQIVYFPSEKVFVGSFQGQSLKSLRKKKEMN